MRASFVPVPKARFSPAADVAGYGDMARRFGAIGLTLMALDAWRRIPPAQRKQILDAAREHGPRLAKSAMDKRRARRPLR
jgi:TRAP-type C4-dicarboxylate transport system substrate-binding protein